MVFTFRFFALHSLEYIPSSTQFNNITKFTNINFWCDFFFGFSAERQWTKRINNLCQFFNDKISIQLVSWVMFVFLYCLRMLDFRDFLIADFSDKIWFAKLIDRSIDYLKINTYSFDLSLVQFRLHYPQQGFLTRNYTNS